MKKATRANKESGLYVDISHIYPAFTQLKKMGYTDVAALHTFGFDRGCRSVDDLPERISLAEFVAAIARAKTVSGDPLFCLKAGMLQSAGDFSPLARMASLCRDLQQVIELYCHYLPAWNPGFPTYIKKLKTVTETPVINKLFSVSESSALMEYRISSCLRMLRLISLNAACDPIAYVSFCHDASAEKNAYESLLGTAVRFNQPYTCFAIRNKSLEYLIPSHNKIMLDQVLKKAEALRVSQGIESGNILIKIRALIRSGMPKGRASLEHISSSLATSSSSIKRYLASEGTSFQTLLDEERKSAIADLLINSKLSNQEIAAKTGITSASSFSQICKRLFGATAMDIRKNKVRVADD